MIKMVICVVVDLQKSAQVNKMKNIYLVLKDKRTGKEFKKYFETEYLKEEYKRRSKYFKNIIIILDSEGDSYE